VWTALTRSEALFFSLFGWYKADSFHLEPKCPASGPSSLILHLVALGKIFNLSEPPFAYLENGVLFFLCFFFFFCFFIWLYKTVMMMMM
jgi:hypothetical protein